MERKERRANIALALFVAGALVLAMGLPRWAQAVASGEGATGGSASAQMQAADSGSTAEPNSGSGSASLGAGSGQNSNGGSNDNSGSAGQNGSSGSQGSGTAKAVEVTIEVEGYTGTLPKLVAGEDFTLGQAVKTNPEFMQDSSGNQPLASLIEEKQAQGKKLTWHTADGKDFDWFKTAVSKSITVKGIFVEADYQVAVSFNDGKTSDLSVNVPKGKSFAQAYGSKPATPAKEGWEFLRWVDASTNSTFDFDAPVTASTSVYALYRVSDPAKVTPTDPAGDVPQTLSGNCYIGATWSVHPAQFNVSGFDGGLEGCSGTGSCSLPSAAAPSYVWATYVATLNHVDIEAGEVVYDVSITPPDAASPDGPRNSMGLIGYQTVAMQAVVKKNFGGYLEISKQSLNPGISTDNGNYSLDGAVFGVYDQQGQRVSGLTTGADGKTAKSELLPVGTYAIHEETAPKGYAPAQDKSTTVESGQTVTVNISDAPQCANISIVGQKHDAETGAPYPMGSATFNGAQYRVSYYDTHLNSGQAMENTLSALGLGSGTQLSSLGTPKRTWLLQTDADGRIKLSKDYLVEGDEFYKDVQGNTVLPLGVVSIEEVKAPTGYLLNSAPVVIDLTASGNAEHIADWEPVELSEQVVRGDFSFIKAKNGSMERLANVPFTITSRTTGESHTLVTDENGMASTEASWAPHSQNTNVGTSSNDGIWFEKDSHGNTAKANDELGALPYDTYDVEEQPCEANEGAVELAKFTVTITRNEVTLNLGTVDNDFEEPEIEVEELEISGDIDKRETLLDESGQYFYTVDYRSTSNTWVDEFTMTDTLVCAKENLAHLVSLTTPVSFEDYDGKMNVWYRTNFDDERDAKTAESSSTTAKGNSDSQGSSNDAASSSSKVNSNSSKANSTANSSTKANSGDSSTTNESASGKSANSSSANETASNASSNAKASANSANGTSTSGSNAVASASANNEASKDDPSSSIASNGNNDESASGEIAVNACSTNPFNEANPTNKRIHDFTGWQVWKTNVSTLEADELKVADLNLQEGEYITAFAFEHGRVEEGFGTNAQDASDWKRSERYEAADLTELDQERTTFNLQEATGTTRTSEEKQVAYTPAVLTMQATEEALAAEETELWNDTEIDTHRNLELHDEDKDSVVQYISQEKTVSEAVAAKLPKTEDVAQPGTALTLFALLAGSVACAAASQPALQRRRIKKAVLGRL
jgi:hypothetical protein